MADDEPSLGATNGMNQEHAWRPARALIEDGEQEHDGREPDADFELEPDLEPDDGEPIVSRRAPFTTASCIITGPDGEAYLAQALSPLGRLDETIERVELLRSTAGLLNLPAGQVLNATTGGRS